MVLRRGGAKMKNPEEEWPKRERSSEGNCIWDHCIHN